MDLTVEIDFLDTFVVVRFYELPQLALDRTFY